MRAPERRVRLRDVAEAAGVSLTTASHALNGKGRVDSSTIARVHEVAAGLRYRPDPRGRALRTGASHSLGIVSAPRDFSPNELEGRLSYHMRLATAAATEALRSDYALLLFPLYVAEHWFDTVLLDGVIVVHPMPGDVLVTLCRDRRIPYVTVGRDAFDAPGGQPSVAVDGEAAVRLALDHLRERGSKHPALFVPTLGATPGEVEVAYRASAARDRYEPIVRRLATDDAVRRSAAAMRDVLHDDPDVDGVFCGYDAHAAGAVRGTRESGRSVPDDVRVVGAEGFWTQQHDLSITAVDHRPDLQGVEAVRLVVGLLAGDGNPQRARVAPELILRSTT